MVFEPSQVFEPSRPHGVTVCRVELFELRRFIAELREMLSYVSLRDVNPSKRDPDFLKHPT